MKLYVPLCHLNKYPYTSFTYMDGGFIYISWNFKFWCYILVLGSILRYNTAD